jgi:glutamine synthetase
MSMLVAWKEEEDQMRTDNQTGVEFLYLVFVDFHGMLHSKIM